MLKKGMFWTGCVGRPDWDSDFRDKTRRRIRESKTCVRTVRTEGIESVCSARWKPTWCAWGAARRPHGAGVAWAGRRRMEGDVTWEHRPNQGGYGGHCRDFFSPSEWEAQFKVLSRGLRRTEGQFFRVHRDCGLDDGQPPRRWIGQN